MAKHEVLAGQVDYSVLVFIPDSAQTDGSGKTGLVAANLTVSYVRVETDNDVTVTDVTSSLNNLAALTTAHTDWGLLEVSSTLAPGLYRLDIADAVFGTGAWSAVVYVMVTTSAAAASPMEFVMVPNAPLTGVLLAPVTHTSAVIPTVTTTGTATAVTTVNGLAANVITAASMAADAGAEIAGAVWDEDATGHQTQGSFGQAIGDPVADTNTIYKAVVTDATGVNVAADVVALKAETVTILADTNELQTDWANGGRLDLILDIIAADTTTDIPALIATLQAFVDTEVASILAAVDTEVAAILVDTNELQTDWTNGGRLDLILDIIAADTTTDIPAVIATLQTFVDTEITAIDDLLDTELPALTTAVADLPTNAELATALGTADDAVLAQIALVKAVTDALAQSVKTIVEGTCDAGSTTTSIVASATSPASGVNDQFNGRIMIFTEDTTTVALRGQATDITDYVHATKTFTVTALTTGPASGDTFCIL